MLDDYRALLDDGSAQDIINWAKAELVAEAAFALASDYGTVKPWQEVAPPSWRSHPRRPVAMRGSRIALEGRFAAKSDHAHELTRRYLRLIRWTDIKGWQVPERLRERLSSRFGLHIALLAIKQLQGVSLWVDGAPHVGITREQRKSLEHMHSFMESLS